MPGIYSKLLDIDKVDLVVSGYGTNLIAPAMPIMIERKLLFMGLFGLGNNQKHKYSRYFQIAPSGPDPAGSFSEGFFELAAKQTPMAEQNFNQAVKIADRGCIIVHGRIEFEGRSAHHLTEHDLVKKYYLGV